MFARKLTIALALSAFSFGCKDSTSPPGTGTTTDTTVTSTKPWRNGPLTIGTIGSVGLVSERITAEVAADGDVAYTTTWGLRSGGTYGNATKVWNVSGNTPVLVDSLIVADPRVNTTSNVQISDDKKLLVVSMEGAYGGGAIKIYDRTVPTKPVLLSTFQSQSTLPGVHTVKMGRVNGRLYAFLQIDPSPVETVIVDITTPSAPVEITHFVTGNPTYVHDVFFRDGYLFSANWNEGLKIFDVGAGTSGGSISAPKQIGAIVTAPRNDLPSDKNAYVHNIYWYQDPAGGAFAAKYAFVGQEGPGGVGASSSGDIHVVDVSDKTNPKEVAFYAVPGAGTHNFVVDEANGILYAAYYNGGVRALDIRGDLSTCTTAQKATDVSKTRCDLRLMGREAGIWLPNQTVYIWGVALVGTKLYASDMINGIWKLDVSNIHP